jgi:putative transposase
VEPDVRDRVVDFVDHWHERSGLRLKIFIRWLGLGMGKFHSWRERYGKDNAHNGKIPRDYWVTDEEKKRIVEFYRTHPLEGYRAVSYLMLDQDVVAVSPATTWRVLHNAGLLRRWNEGKKSLKGSGFRQPLKPHEHWHVDISYLNICGTFYYLITVLDGCSRYVVHWDIRTAMTEQDVELVLQRAREKFPGVTPRIISDNGPQFIAREFKEFVRISGMSHVRTSPYYPQSNGKLERYHRTIKHECIRPNAPVSLDDALRIVENFVAYYNRERLHSAIRFVTPLDKLEGREQQIFDARDAKLEAARARRKMLRERNLIAA